MSKKGIHGDRVVTLKLERFEVSVILKLIRNHYLSLRDECDKAVAMEDHTNRVEYAAAMADYNLLHDKIVMQTGVGDTL